MGEMRVKGSGALTKEVIIYYKKHGKGNKKEKAVSRWT